MPYSWITPNIFMEYKGMVVYHTYKSDMIDNVRQYWFTLNILSTDDKNEYDFDVRDLDQIMLHGKNWRDYERIIANAIDHHKLELPSGVKYKQEKVKDVKE